MESYDLLMLLLLAAGAVFGAWKGFAWQVASVASIVVSYIVAVRFRGPLSSAIDAEPPWNMFLAMLILYIGASLVVWIGFGLVRRFITRMRLRSFDRQIGALLGVAKGALVCVIVTLFAVTLAGEQRRQAIVNSTSGYYIAVLLDRSHSLFPPEVHEVLHPYIEKLDEDHGRRRHFAGESPSAPSSAPSSTPTSAPTFGGPLFGSGTPPAPPASSWPSTSSRDTDARSAAQPLEDLRQWGQQRIRQGKQQVQDTLRDEIQRQTERFLPR